MLEREHNERDVLDALGEYKCDAGMSVEDVPAIVNTKTLKGRFTQLQYWVGGGCGEEWKRSRVLMTSFLSSIS